MSIQNPYNYGKPMGMQASIKKQSINGAKPQQSKTPQDIYLEQKVMQAKPEELTYMLYDALIKNIKKALLLLETKEISKVNEAAKKAQDILYELIVTLNHEIQVSDSFLKMYEYTIDQLVEGNMKKEKGPFEEALKISEEFKSSWGQAFDIKD